MLDRQLERIVLRPFFIREVLFPLDRFQKIPGLFEELLYLSKIEGFLFSMERKKADAASRW